MTESILLKIVENYGPVAAILIFVLWWMYRMVESHEQRAILREQILRDSCNRLDEFCHTTLIAMFNELKAVVAQNSVAMEKCIEHQHRRNN